MMVAMSIPSNEIRLRPAGADDAEGFARVFLDCWRISYARTMPAQLVARVDATGARDLWTSALAGGRSIYVAADTGEETDVIGFVGYRLTTPDSGYVSSLYVSPHSQGAGAGRMLLGRAEADLRALGARTARLCVFEQNAPSRAFYERGGWRADGTRETSDEWGEPQIGMDKRLGA
jgi:ribosomal protein S18 acetylase RimI-like enzyme